MKRMLLPMLIAAILLCTTPAVRVFADDGNPPAYSVRTIAVENGALVDESTISGPPHPPPGYELQRAPATLPKPENALGSKLLSVPAFRWSFGCSATSGAMIAGYYDRNGFTNMYSGPTNGGTMLLDSSPWGYWTDGHGDTYAQCPLTASRSGLDGRGTRGSIDDYWVAYGSSANDPYVTNGWSQHALGDAIGDYMKTSQSAYGNSDGATVFYNWSSGGERLTCADMVQNNITKDGTYGRKLFYEAKGYTVTDCYNQRTDNIGGGFTFALYKAEINAGRPVMLNLAGHTVVGVGYDDAGSTVYLHDTWDYNNHTMTWGGTYSGMALQSVSIVNLICEEPADATNLAIARMTDTDVKLTWGAAAGADHYEVWSAINQTYFSPGADCRNPAPFACTTIAGTSLTEAALGSSTSNHSYAVRAVSACGATSASASGHVGEFEYDLLRGGQP